MLRSRLKPKQKEWLKRYIPAEILSTTTALIAAWVTFGHTHSFIAATAAGWAAEGVGFYGYFITRELVANSQRYAHRSLVKQIALAIAAASTNLLVEFLPAEILDNFILRPYLLYLVPQYVRPYPLGFLAGKFSADILFYALAIGGYEARKRWL